MDKIKKELIAFGKRTINLNELEEVIKPYKHTYEDFSSTILQLEEDNIISMVKSKGRTTRKPSLAKQYRIDKSALTENYHKELQYYRAQLDPSISIDKYYGNPSDWKTDLPYILKVDEYLKKNFYPTDKVPAPERSYELVGDEKWITENSGKSLLEKINVYDKLNIIPVSDPMMFAINPLKLAESKQLHIIVENKTTYQALLPVITETEFSTLVYGSGKKVIKSIEQFELQYPIKATHQFFYFGDIDREGINIWYSLTKQLEVKLAIPFYLECLKKEAALGKGYQKSNGEAEDKFIRFFPENVREQISTLLKNGKYHPQETLNTNELQKVWRESFWRN
ncbi:Wadjet anti-phage system protein JetD domain-containing protein [Evansella cellulosilytica]|uniref:Wadjet protein JetD C-terminal domain-containing protein n=1 Tax=Evansella cellulosilytica (strain ATCC 21833 / DSM 2522 / FERM P-1141 / JCM 9156 / N-4) TaxID=649639 RepID=E6TQH7_EVAC2|nr:Wadjet anti-phage system protein JetD domain-containing protein [Evansella cellulosilytica]ADU29355.1 hypothetical protein Bcell_1085 [Evansella cellulosilytica DSM 2522]